MRMYPPRVYMRSLKPWGKVKSKCWAHMLHKSSLPYHQQVLATVIIGSISLCVSWTSNWLQHQVLSSTTSCEIAKERNLECVNGWGCRWGWDKFRCPPPARASRTEILNGSSSFSQLMCNSLLIIILAYCIYCCKLEVDLSYGSLVYLFHWNIWTTSGISSFYYYVVCFYL